ncbi:MAG TPA: hypothetical protein VKE40_00235 [Gemmataceae bacterium]|nr:hypothetical protein [Gemmataceae bacterium]
MAFRHQGNGEDRTQIDFVARPNYVLICPLDATNLPPNIAAIVNRALTDWLKRTPGIRVRAVLPITQDGQTTAVHVWYDSADPAG